MSNSALIMQYRGKIGDQFGNRLRKLVPYSIIFTTRKLRSVLPSSKCGIDPVVKSHVVYEIASSRCHASYVGQTVRHLTTRAREHGRESAPLGAHLKECDGSWSVQNVKVIDSCNILSKLLTLETLYIAPKKASLSRREEYRQRELTLCL